MVFAADDLGAWLVGLLADAGRKKLTELVLGSEQERALRSAATAAVRLTAAELRPDDDEQAEHAALVISQVFSAPVPGAPLSGAGTVLEGLQAGIAGQLAVLDDASLTGTRQSSADVLGVPGTVLAERLAAHLLHQIVVRGSGGGPLFALASQLNDDVTHLQGQRIEGKLDQLAFIIREELPIRLRKASDGNRPDGTPSLPMAASWPRVEDADPLVFGVHRARLLGHGDSLLPPYVRRDIDGYLRERLAAAGEQGGLVLLIGDSTAGKTRTAFEAMRCLFPDRRVLAPPRDADVSAVPRLLDSDTAQSLLWLDDLESYLRPRGLDPVVLAALTERRMLILATMRSEQYEAYPRHAQSLHLGAIVLNLVEPIEIARLWSSAELGRVADSKDERLQEAAADHGSVGVAEYLAAGPPLLLEWHQASRVGGHPRGAALVSAAVDLARIGLRGPIPEELLRRPRALPCPGGRSGLAP